MGATDASLEEFPAIDVARWRARIEKGGASVESLRALGADGVAIDPLYVASARELASPRTDARWAIAQEYAVADPSVLAEALACDTKAGLEAAWIRLDPALTSGIAAIAPASPRPGVRLQLVSVLAGIDAHVVIEAGAAGSRVRDMAAGDRVWVLGDPLAALAESGGLAVDVEKALADLRELASQAAPGMRTVVASAVPYHDAGAAVADEVAIAIATAIEYARACELDIAAFSRTLVLRFGVGPDVVVELAKLRAARWLWGAVGNHLGAVDAGREVCVAARTSWRHAQHSDPWVNQLRATTGALAAALAGVDVLAVQPLDELDAVPQENARRWALGIQHLLREESQLDAVVDPAGGSFALESLAEQIARAAWARVREIEAAGGMTAALREGSAQAWAAATAAARRAEAEKAGILGVTRHPPAQPTWTFGPAQPSARPPTATPAVRVQPLVPARISAPFEEGAP